MDMATASIVVAAISAVGAIIVAFVQKFRKENHTDHAMVMNAVDRLSNTMDRVEGKVDSHIEWHLSGGTTNGRTTRRNKTGSRKAS
jgi:hypothetical protein